MEYISDNEFNSLKERAEKDDAQALYDLGNLFRNEGRYQEALNCYCMAAQRGNFHAQVVVLLYYSETLDLDDAEEYYILAERGDPHMQTKIGIYWAEEECFDEAEKYYRLAADNGYDNAQNNLAMLMERYHKYDEAIKYYRLAAKQGNVKALFNLGVLSFLLEDLDEADYCFKLAAANGHKDSKGWVQRMSSITPAEYKALWDAVFKDRSILVAKTNKIRALKNEEMSYRRQAGEGDPKGFYNIGVLMEKQERFYDAEEYYRMAASRGVDEAKKALENLLNKES